ncbi:hypothetical protein JL722_3309 [Aureococcus anophagefferens]|nr:hypothetical protein JL722_3309 [Aureococcus anophagefferens]
MSLTHAKNNVWTCESCNCKTNPVRAVECAICGTAAPKTKFGRKAHGSYVLVSLNNAKRRAFARVFDLRTDTVLTEELPAAEELDDRVAVALRTALDAGYQAKVRHEKHRRHSTAQTLAKRVHREREAEESRARVTGDLFAQVAAGAEIDRRAGTSGPRFRVMAHDRSQANVQRMLGQQSDMRRRIEAIAVEPDLHSYDDDPRSRYASSVDEDEARVLIDAGAAARAAMVPCTCCERPYRARAMLGVASFHAVAEWRRRRGADIPRGDARHGITKRYEGVKLCVFCTQFFDDEFCDYVRISGDAAVVDDPVLRLAKGPEVEIARPHKGEAQRAVGVLGLAAAAAAAAGAHARGVPLPPVASARPASTLRQRMAKSEPVSELQMRASQPLKMDPWGSHLAAHETRKPPKPLPAVAKKDPAVELSRSAPSLGDAAAPRRKPPKKARFAEPPRAAAPPPAADAAADHRAPHDARRDPGAPEPPPSPSYKAVDDASNVYVVSKRRRARKRAPYARSTARPPVRPDALLADRAQRSSMQKLAAGCRVLDPPGSDRKPSLLTDGSRVPDAKSRFTAAAQPHCFTETDGGLAKPRRRRKKEPGPEDHDHVERDARASWAGQRPHNFDADAPRAPSIYGDGKRVPEPKTRNTAKHVPFMFTHDTLAEPTQRRAKHRDKRTMHSAAFR